MRSQRAIFANRIAARSGLMLLASLLAGCGGGSPSVAPPPPPNPVPSPTVATPLNDLGAATYKGFSGGLYPNGSNQIPAQHFNAGVGFAQAVQRRDTNGNPSASGKFVLLSIGMSNTTQEFCSGNNSVNCAATSFMGQAAADAAVNTAGLTLVDGARGGQTAATWDSANDPNYDDVRNNRLVPLGLSEAQVQIAWVKVANAQPTVALPAINSDAVTLLTQMGNIVRALKARYPNLKMVFLSSRIYAGYATSPLNPEPFAYESGLAVKWLVEAQINQVAAGGAVQDARAGDLNYNTGVAPWIAWGPYLWGDGNNMRSDGLVWIPADFQNDGTHPSQSGVQKVGGLLLNFFKTSPHSKCWFVTGGTCP